MLSLDFLDSAIWDGQSEGERRSPLLRYLYVAGSSLRRCGGMMLLYSVQNLWGGSVSEDLDTATTCGQKLKSYKCVFGALGVIAIAPDLFSQPLVFYSPREDRFFIGRWMDMRLGQPSHDLLFRCSQIAVEPSQVDDPTKNPTFFRSQYRVNVEVLPPLQPVFVRVLRSLIKALGLGQTQAPSGIKLRGQTVALGCDT